MRTGAPQRAESPVRPRCSRLRRGSGPSPGDRNDLRAAASNRPGTPAGSLREIGGVQEPSHDPGGVDEGREEDDAGRSAPPRRCDAQDQPHHPVGRRQRGGRKCQRAAPTSADRPCHRALRSATGTRRTPPAAATGPARGARRRTGSTPRASRRPAARAADARAAGGRCRAPAGTTLRTARAAARSPQGSRHRAAATTASDGTARGSPVPSPQISGGRDPGAAPTPCRTTGRIRPARAAGRRPAPARGRLPGGQRPRDGGRRRRIVV